MKEMILKTKRLLLWELKQDDFDDICTSAAQQLLCACITADMRMHNS